MEVTDSTLPANASMIQGVNVEELCNTYGSPLYVYDADKMVSQLEKLKHAFRGTRVVFKYAAKALTNLAVLKLMKNNGTGMDAVSIQEVHLGIQAGFDPADILFTPNCVSFEEVKEAVNLGVQINIDNISLLEQFGDAYHNSVPCCIRLNPNIMAGGNANISVGHIDSKFGISIHQLKHILRVVKTHNIRVNGLHVHTGSDIIDTEVFLLGAQIIFDAARNFNDLEFIDFGSGFKVAYQEGDISTDLDYLGSKMIEVFEEFCADYGRDLELWFEPGKFLVSEAGSLLTRVNVVKTTPATVFAGVDSGLNHLIRPMMYDAHHEIENISNPTGVKRVYTVVGYICETDTFGYDRRLNEVREGDILAMKNAGAYGFSMASNYNSRFRPAEVLIYQGKAHLIRKRESFDDILRNQVDADFI
jgi:diaminopimelate decarboxylase